MANVSVVKTSEAKSWMRSISCVIKRRVAHLDPVKVGLRTSVLASIQVGDHSSKALGRFATDIVAMEEVLDFYRTAGDVDYFLLSSCQMPLHSTHFIGV
jgi:hypothetical protein